MQGKGNIERFLRNSLGNLDHDFQDDWTVFERKLEQALYIRYIQRMAWMGFTTMLLIGLFIGTNVYEYYDREYIPRSQQNKNIEIYSSAKPAMMIGGKGTDRQKQSESVVVKPAFNVDEQNITVKHANQKTSEVTPVAMAVKKTEDPLIPSQSHIAYPEKPALNETRSEKPMAGGMPADNSHADVITTATEVVEREEQLTLSRSELGVSVPQEIPAKSILNSPSNSLRISSGVDLGEATASYAHMSLRFPIEVRKVEEEDRGPYVSPLQEISPWSYSVNIYPNFTFRKFKVDEDKTDMLHRDFMDAVQSAENGGFNLNIGLRISRRIGKITFLNSGVEYITYKNEVVYNFTNFRDAHINPETGAIEGYTLKSKSEHIGFSDINTYNYINIPLSVSYQPWASDHIRLNIEAGASYLRFMSAHGQTLNYKTLEIVDLSTRKFKRSIASFSFKVGANYYVNQRINIGFEPTIMYFTNTIYSNDYPFHVIPYSVGLNLKFQVKLN